jgi:type I restriction enzyme S subunit
MIMTEPLQLLVPRLPSGWKVRAFSELLAEPVRNGVYRPKEFHGEGLPIVNMGELFAYDFISDQNTKLITLTGNELSRYTLEDGDILFARRSLVLEGSGKCTLVVRPSRRTTFESSIIRARPNKKLVLPRFLFHLFKSPLGRAIVASIASRTAVSGIRSSDLSQLALPVPGFKIQ